MTYLLAEAGIREFGLLIEGELQRPRPPGDFDRFLITMISADDEQEDDPINQPTTIISNIIVTMIHTLVIRALRVSLGCAMGWGHGDGRLRPLHEKTRDPRADRPRADGHLQAD